MSSLDECHEIDDDYLAFIKQITGTLADLDTASPLDIAGDSYDLISSTLHMAWIRRILAPVEVSTLSITNKVIDNIWSAYICKSSSWTITEGVHILCNESPIIDTPSRRLRRGEIDGYIEQARRAAQCGKLKATLSDQGNYLVEPEELMKWAKTAGIPVDEGINNALHAGKLGSTEPRQRGRPALESTTQKRDQWNEIAKKMKKDKPRLNKSAIANKISMMVEGMGNSPETIRRRIKL
jgi:hypothetical protein